MRKPLRASGEPGVARAFAGPSFHGEPRAHELTVLGELKGGLSLGHEIGQNKKGALDPSFYRAQGRNGLK